MRKNRKSKTRWIKWVVVIVVVAVLGVFAWPSISSMLSGGGQAQQMSGDMQSGSSGSVSAGSYTAVSRGSISKTVYGSGNLTPSVSRTVYSGAPGKVSSVSAQVGDSVKAGDIIFTLESSDLETEIASLESELFAQQISMSAVRDSGSTSTIYSPAAGRVKLVKIEKDDDIEIAMKQYGYLMIISRDGKMRVEFAPEGNANWSVGDPVMVWIDGTGVEGVIDQVSGLQGNIAVTISDDTYEVGKYVLVTTPQGVSVGSGNLQINLPIPVTGTGGTVSKVYYDDNDTVSSGSSLVYVTGRIPSSDLKQAYLSYEEARISLEKAQMKQDSLIIRAPIDGVITAINAAEGESLQESAAAFTIQSNKSYQVVATVDELDIVDVSVGQEVEIDFDAYPNKTYRGAVTRISGVGTVSGGVATYEVTIALDEAEGLMDGLTASAEIVVANRENVLLVPVEAVSTSGGQNYVTLSSGQTSNVTIGVSDDTNVEILTGVNEGDSVLITRSSSSSTNSSSGFAGGQSMPSMGSGGGGGQMRSPMGGF